MSQEKLPEVWLRGPLPSIPPLLQPVAHALLQAAEEINAILLDFNEDLLWKRPAMLASAGFHLQHIAGVQDRLFTYAKGEALSESQLAYLKSEGKENETITLAFLLEHLHQQTEKSIEQLKQTDESTLTEIRYVGRKQIPSTVMGLLFHSAEHTMRHTGQLLVTIKVLQTLKFD
ncbi:DinB family protein [Parafilimonas terrae]|uniref:DinB superfamily protein n=1 Tax=Parafilimonas terrae TaxID=1465490 RepID=A0A1I5Z4D3_9BACT|nr:DinB family protein [Parafilimonas terrae]SFQ51155.1 DinB superfamily protein [Parafilimonas terrae]